MKDKKQNEKNQFEQFKRKRHLIKPILVITLLIILQMAFFIYLYNSLKEYVNIYNWSSTGIVLIAIIYIINMDQPIDYRVAWMIPITVFPLFGIFLYLLLEILPGPKGLAKRLQDIKYKNMKYLYQDESIKKEIKTKGFIDYGLEKYLYETAGYPIYKNTKAKYFSSGEEYYSHLIEDLKNAKQFIFIEFFIVREGIMLDSIVEILASKVKEGVVVKFMYDGTNDYTLDPDYKKYLESFGIEVEVFAAVKPILSTYHNNRDHRKIVSIDNKIGYTGGINLADEYINETERFGHWKDNGIRIEGEAVTNLTVMFLNLWELSSKKVIEISQYISNKHSVFEDKALIQPFDDSPNDNESVGENTYVGILNQAKDYVYIMTPYLILSEKIRDAIIFASKRGVDVRILMPGIPDKKIPFNMGRSYYENLLKNGVKIYEYSPGFLHSKAIVTDDISSVVGTINLDFRSLHLHYENGILIHDRNFALDLKNDVLQTVELSREMTIKSYRELNVFYRLIGKALRLIAPLM
nr:cardiolipin synthase [Helcococcus sueciensis]